MRKTEHLLSLRVCRAIAKRVDVAGFKTSRQDAVLTWGDALYLEGSIFLDLTWLAEGGHGAHQHDSHTGRIHLLFTLGEHLAVKSDGRIEAKH
jgi:hypothetical protein